jgi:hypothetical protein
MKYMTQVTLLVTGHHILYDAKQELAFNFNRGMSAIYNATVLDSLLKSEHLRM